MKKERKKAVSRLSIQGRFRKALSVCCGKRDAAIGQAIKVKFDRKYQALRFERKGCEPIFLYDENMLIVTLNSLIFCHTTEAAWALLQENSSEVMRERINAVAKKMAKLTDEKIKIVMACIEEGGIAVKRNYAKIAYDAWCEAQNWATASGGGLPSWEQLETRAAVAWKAAIIAVEAEMERR